MGKKPRRDVHAKPKHRFHQPSTQFAQTKNAGTFKKTATIAKLSTEQQRPKWLPFNSLDNILLVGEGDFSFAHSLLVNHPHSFRSLCATSFDSREELLEKYPQAKKYVTTLSHESETSAEGISEPTAIDSDGEIASSSPLTEEFSSFSSSSSSITEALESNVQSPARPHCSILYSIDATALHKYKAIRTRKWDRVVFNFPHVGGKSTDVNRQVRYNQALVHDFLRSCISLLSQPDGTILVTVFEGAPYDLWNIRDLGRSAGLRVVRSFQFQPQLYPGYEHARTCGNIRAKDERPFSGGMKEPVHVDDDKNIKNGTNDGPTPRPGKWRGEERQARTYEFGLISNDITRSTKAKRKRKRKDHDDETQSDMSDG